MEPDRAPPPAEVSDSWQLVARIALAIAVIAIGLWILREFLAALAWAGVLAIALGPLYQRLLALLPAHSDRALGPLLATTVVAIVFIVPLVLLGIALAREIHVVISFVGDARHHGIAVPDWVGQLPLVGAMLAEWWHDNLSEPGAAEDL